MGGKERAGGVEWARHWGLGLPQMPVGHRSRRVESGAHERTVLQRETWCPWHRDGIRVHRQNKVTIGGGEVRVRQERGQGLSLGAFVRRPGR